MKIYDAENTLLLDVEVDDNSYRNRAIMGDHNITLYYSLAEHVELPVGAWCEYQNELFTLERPQAFKMKHSRQFDYTVTMESDEARAKMWMFRNMVEGDNRVSFSYTAKPREHLQMFVDNMNARDDSGDWEIGECVEAAETLISYDYVYCWDALTLMATTFETEFEIVGHTVSLHRVEYDKENPLPLAYGCGNGFKPNVGRSNSSDTPPVERLYVQGGEDNIDSSSDAYGNATLLLPRREKNGGAEVTIAYDGEKFYYPGDAGFDAEGSRRYIVDEDGFSIQRLDKTPTSYAEDSLDCTEIYPRYTCTVTKVEVTESGFYNIYDETMPEALDYTDNIIAGEQMTVVFQSGMLSGRELGVDTFKKLDGTTGMFMLVSEEIDGQIMPNSVFCPRESDTFIVFGCSLPDAYIYDRDTGAEWEMLRKAVKYMYENEEETFTFTGELDGIWAKKDWTNISGRLRCGGYILFTDESFCRDGALVRIKSIKDYVNKPHSPVIELSNETQSASVSSVLKELKSQEVQIANAEKNAVSYTKRRYRDTQETIEMLEAAIGSLSTNFTESITPITAQTMMMLVGDESLQFHFVESVGSTVSVAHSVTWNSTRKRLYAAAGIIQHYTIGIDYISSSTKEKTYRYWTLEDYETFLTDDEDKDKAFYLYAVCSKNNSGAINSFSLTETPYSFDNGGQYNLLVGILNSEYDGERSFVTLYGFTEILPGRITTESIVSGDGTSYFDMLNNALKLGDLLKFNTDGNGQLKLKGTIVQSTGDGTVESYLGCYRGAYDDTYTYGNGDEVYYTVDGVTSTYRYIGGTTSTGVEPTNTAYWTVLAAGVKGEAADYYEYRYRVNGSSVEAPSLADVDRYPDGWSTDMPEVSAGYFLWMTMARIDGETDKLADGYWGDPIRITPVDGSSPVCVYQGVYDSDKIYYGTSIRVDAVKYGDTYFVTRVDAGTFYGVAPDDTEKWNPFGATFESVATELLLAEGAQIGDWYISEGKIVSTLSDGNKITLDAKNNRIEVVSDKSQGSASAEDINSVITISANTGIIRVESSDSSAESYISSTGIFSNRAGNSCYSASTGRDCRAAVVGHGFGTVDKYPFSSSSNADQNMLVGVFGDVLNKGTANSYGGYFSRLKAAGFLQNVVWVKEDNLQLSYVATFVLGTSSENLTVYLPTDEIYEGHTIMFYQLGGGTLTISVAEGSGQCIYSTLRSSTDKSSTSILINKTGSTSSESYDRWAIAVYTPTVLNIDEANYTSSWCIIRQNY